jgi:hypothetical protein
MLSVCGTVRCTLLRCSAAAYLDIVEPGVHVVVRAAYLDVVEPRVHVVVLLRTWMLLSQEYMLL